MTRSRWTIVAFVAVALIWGYVAGIVLDGAGANPYAAPATTLLVVAAFGWFRREREIGEVVVPAIGVAYAAYVGIALARVGFVFVPSAGAEMAFRLGWFAVVGPFTDAWPLVLAAGIPYALLLAVAVALPASMIRGRPKTDPKAHDAFWSAVAEANARNANPHGEKRG